MEDVCDMAGCCIFSLWSAPSHPHTYRVNFHGLVKSAYRAAVGEREREPGRLEWLRQHPFHLVPSSVFAQRIYWLVQFHFPSFCVCVRARAHSTVSFFPHISFVKQNSSGGNSSSGWAKPSCWPSWTSIAALCNRWAAICSASCRIWEAFIRRWRRRPMPQLPPTNTIFHSAASRSKAVWRYTFGRPWPLAATFGPASSK